MFKAVCKYGALISFWLVYAINICAQSFTTKLYTTADGLSDNYIFCVYQDSYGYIWAGTPNGLNRFDGKRFTNYGLKNGLPSLFVDRVYEDRDHRLWIGTRRGMAEMKGDSCYVYPLSDGLELDFVGYFFEPAPGKLWASTDKGFYEMQDGKWNKIALSPGYENAFAGVILHRNGGLLINYGGRLMRQQNHDGSFTNLFSVQLNRPYYHSVFQKNDTLFMGTYTGLKYLKDNKWVGIFEDTLSKKYIYSSFLDKAGRYWFGTEEDGVLGIIPQKNGNAYVHIPLSFNLVSGFYEDRENNIWVAGFQGLLKISPAPYDIQSLPFRLRSARHCIITPANDIIVSDDNGKLFVLKIPMGEPVRHVATMTLQYPDDFVDFYTFDEKQRMWLTTRSGDLYLQDRSSMKKFTQIIHGPNNGSRGIVFDTTRKKLWVCGDSVLFTGNETRLDTFFSSNGHKFVPLPWKIFLDEATGALLVQTMDDGLMLVTPGGTIEPLGKELMFGLSAKEPGNRTNGSFLWAVTRGKSIKKYLWRNGDKPIEKESVSQAEGLPDHYILDVASGNEGKLWIATSRGVTILQKNHSGAWVHRDIEINESGTVMPLSFSKLAVDSKGNVWMTTNTRLIRFDSKIASVQPLQTTTVIEKVLLFDRPTDWARLTDSVQGYHQLPVDPVLAHNKNTLSIIFNGLQLSDNSLLEYSYRLLPADTNWSNATASNIVSFFQLSPEQYHFEVRSRIKGFEWSDPARFSFTIRKPFWETWLFRAALIFLASALIIFIFRYRIRQMKARSGMENQIRELEMKALKAQMNPHFIHNALNSIQSLIINNRTSEASHYVSKFAKLLRQVLENADKNLISLDKELYSLQLYMDLEKLRMNMDVDYKEQVDEQVIPSEIKIPPLILQPFVENALWHGLSNKAGDKKINLSIKEKDGWIICEITDNGIGRKKASEAGKLFPEGSFSKAVNITTQRLADFNQSQGIEPVSFIDLVNNNEPAGTTVIIRIRARSGD